MKTGVGWRLANRAIGNAFSEFESRNDDNTNVSQEHNHPIRQIWHRTQLHQIGTV